jgi:hypothetical protein
MGKYIPKTEQQLLFSASLMRIRNRNLSVVDALERVIKEEKTIKDLLDNARKLGIVK